MYKYLKDEIANLVLLWKHCQGNIESIKTCQLVLTDSNPGEGGYFGVKRIGMTVGNPRKLP